MQKGDWRIVVKGGRGDELDFEIMPGNVPIRYLGIWLNANDNSEKGLRLLKEKVMARLKGIAQVRAGVEVKNLLVKSRVLSVINFYSWGPKYRQRDFEAVG